MSEAIFTKIKDGKVSIYNERGQFLANVTGNCWVSSSVSGDKVVVSSEDGRTEIYDKRGGYVGHM
ncbi:MAG: hypothetical protein WCL54_08515 [Clostridia bacterium]